MSFFFSLILLCALEGSDSLPQAQGPIPLCGTQERPALRLGSWNGINSICWTNGTCDLPNTRNYWVPDQEWPLITIRLRFIVFDSTTTPELVQQRIEARMVELNSDFASSRIQFDAETETIADSEFEIQPDIQRMKATHAFEPQYRLHIYVVRRFPTSLPYAGLATFPWDEALEAQGGIMIASLFNVEGSTLTHEIGHALGLYHTFRGVAELQQSGCDALCRERVNDVNADITGDFCSDTPATPLISTCNAVPQGVDACSNLPWGITDLENAMSYSRGCDGGNGHFTAQQSARMRCWIESTLFSWVGGDLLNTVYVDRAASGIERGTQSQPYNTLLEASQVIAPGAEILVRNGLRSAGRLQVRRPCRITVEN